MYTLTLDATPVLVHPAMDQAQQWLLVRLKPVAEPRPPEPAPKEPSPAPEGQEQAYLEIRVPADADVWLDGHKSSQIGSERKFVNPPLKRGSTYAYDVRARWTVDGLPVEQTRKVEVRAGERSRVNFLTPEP